MKFRFHRGSLTDSMATVIEVDSLEELMPLIDFDLPSDRAYLTCTWYAKDDRIDWDTYIVTYHSLAYTFPVGFSNGLLPLRRENEDFRDNRSSKDDAAGSGIVLYV